MPRLSLTIAESELLRDMLFTELGELADAIARADDDHCTDDTESLTRRKHAADRVLAKLVKAREKVTL